MLKFRNDTKLLIVNDSCDIELDKDILLVKGIPGGIGSVIPPEIYEKMTPRRMKLFKNYVYDVICNPNKIVKLPELYPIDYSNYIDLDLLTKSAYNIARALLLKEIYPKIRDYLFQHKLLYPLYNNNKTDRDEYLFDIKIESPVPNPIANGTIDGIPFYIDWLSTAKRLPTSITDPYRKAMESFPKEL